MKYLDILYILDYTIVPLEYSSFGTFGIFKIGILGYSSFEPSWFSLYLVKLCTVTYNFVSPIMKGDRGSLRGRKGGGLMYKRLHFYHQIFFSFPWTFR